MGRPGSLRRGRCAAYSVFALQAFSESFHSVTLEQLFSAPLRLRQPSVSYLAGDGLRPPGCMLQSALEGLGALRFVKEWLEQ